MPSKQRDILVTINSLPLVDFQASKQTLELAYCIPENKLQDFLVLLDDAVKHCGDVASVVETDLDSNSLTPSEANRTFLDARIGLLSEAERILRDNEKL
jgi:hypothetical protein